MADSLETTSAIDLVERLAVAATLLTERGLPFSAQSVEQAADTITRLQAALTERDKCIGVLSKALDEADTIIAVNCGTDTPKEWDRAFRRCAKARGDLSSVGGE